jgi:hypothetical protein
MATEDMAAWHAAAVAASGGLQQVFAQHKSELARIRQGPLTDSQKRREIAASYLAAAEKVAALKRSDTDALDQAQQDAEEQAFKPPASERGDINAVMAARDARDRARQVTKPAAAGELLAEAQAAGDDSLARAVAQHAHRAGWHEVTGKWADSQPPEVRGHLDRWAAANHQQSRAGNMARSMAYRVAQPPEIAGMSQGQMQQLAAEAAGRYGGP